MTFWLSHAPVDSTGKSVSHVYVLVPPRKFSGWMGKQISENSVWSRFLWCPNKGAFLIAQPRWRVDCCGSQFSSFTGSKYVGSPHWKSSAEL